MGDDAVIIGPARIAKVREGADRFLDHGLAAEEPSPRRPAKEAIE